MGISEALKPSGAALQAELEELGSLGGVTGGVVTGQLTGLLCSEEAGHVRAAGCLWCVARPAECIHADQYHPWL